MDNIVDLPRIRRALSELDRIAAEHPEYCQHQGQWDEQEVEKLLMGTPVKERMKAYRSRLKERGHKQVSMYLTPEAVALIDELRQQHPDQSVGELVSNRLVKPGQDGEQAQ
jgi:ElaB/YqjD/DUF883 family membrane-anchored ribosome-binding protein